MAFNKEVQGHFVPSGPNYTIVWKWGELAGVFQHGFAAAGGFFALAQHAWLLVELAAARLSEDSLLLNLFIEAPQCALETLVISYNDVSQSFHPPPHRA